MDIETCYIIDRQIKARLERLHEEFLSMMYSHFGLMQPPSPLNIDYNQYTLFDGMNDTTIIIKAPYGGDRLEEYAPRRRLVQWIKSKELVLGHETGHHLYHNANKLMKKKRDGKANRSITISYLLEEFTAELCGILCIDKMYNKKGLATQLLREDEKESDMIGAVHQRYEEYKSIDEAIGGLTEMALASPRNTTRCKTFQEIKNISNLIYVSHR